MPGANSTELATVLPVAVANIIEFARPRRMPRGRLAGSTLLEVSSEYPPPVDVPVNGRLFLFPSG